MKFFIVFLTVVAFVCADFTDEDRAKWLEFKLEHGKLFLSPGKEKQRMQTFLQNAAAVDAHNEAFANGDVTHETQTHKYSDLSDADFLSRFTGVNVPAEARNVDPSTLVTLRQTPQPSCNLTQVIGPSWTVRDQQQCGSCWAFSTAAAVEYANFKKTGKVLDTSEQQLVDCVYGKAGGCQGGWMPTAFDYLAQNNGITLESAYPYTAVSGTCKSNMAKAVGLNPTKDWIQVASDDNSIKNAICSIGALSVCVDATNYGSYKSGVFNSPDYANPSCEHAVTLVGYGVDGPTGLPYWTIRNSWNTWWGEVGYIRVNAKRDAKTGLPLGGVMLNLAYYPQTV